MSEHLAPTCVTWLIHTSDMPHSHAWHDLPIWATCCIHTDGWRDSIMWEAWRICVCRKGVVYRVATILRLLKITGLFCKRALQKRRYSAKETYNFKEPTNRSHPITHSDDEGVLYAATCWSTLQHCNTLVCVTTVLSNSFRRWRCRRYAATRCNTLQRTATHYNTLQHTATHIQMPSDGMMMNVSCTLQHTATHCNTLQHTATHCNTLQHTATHRNIHSNAIIWHDDECVMYTATYCTLHHTATLIDMPSNGMISRSCQRTHFQTLKERKREREGGGKERVREEGWETARDWEKESMHACGQEREKERER